MLTLSSICLPSSSIRALIFFHELGHFVAAKWAGVRTALLPSAGPVLCPASGIGLVRIHQGPGGWETGSPADKLADEELAQHGLGETEYSLRLLPLGGFVSMLGQEDGKPEAVSDDPRRRNPRRSANEWSSFPRVW